MYKFKENHNFALHGWRYSIATNLPEAGNDLCYIQEMLWHKPSWSTEIYKHVSMKNLKNIKNLLN